MTMELDTMHPLWLAEQEILTNYGDRVSIAQKRKSLLKFGRNDSVGTSYVTVWNQNQDETFSTSDDIDYIVSSSTSDTGSVTVEGHTVTGSGASAQYTFVVQTVTLTGQTKVALTTPLARCSRIYNSSATALVGTVYVFVDTTVTSGVPQTAANIRNIVKAGNNQSYKAATTISNADYYIITQGFGSVAQKTAASVDFRFEIRQPGGVFREQIEVATSSNGGPVNVVLTPPLIVPKNSDIRVRALASTTGVDCEAFFNGYLAKVE